MFLYDKKDNSIDVYSLSRNAQGIRDYKIEQMGRIPVERCLYTEEVVSSFQDVPTLFKKNLDLNIVAKSELIGKDKSIKYNTDLDDCAHLLEWFYSDKCVNRPVARVQDTKKLMYLLIASNDIRSIEENGKVIKRIEDIIEIPKSLYLLQLIEQEKFSMINGEDISEQLGLFDYSYINNISVEELQKIDTCGITEDAYSRVMTKADNDRHILKVLKK